MYRDRLENTKAKSAAAKKLKDVMLRYNEFSSTQSADETLKSDLAAWQSQRLLRTHQDLYQSANYQSGLHFLLSDLYAPKDFSDRDRDLERIFPKLVKLMPDSVLETVATLIELNLMTQQLDESLALTICNEIQEDTISDEIYCEAYRLCDNYEVRRTQIMLISDAGKLLDKYARSSMISFALKLTQGAANKAGLNALHSFISTGFEAFYCTKDIDFLMHTLVKRELKILDNIYSSHHTPFEF